MRHTAIVRSSCCGFWTAINKLCIIDAGATAASLALGRFVFLPFQRKNAQKQVRVSCPVVAPTDWDRADMMHIHGRMIALPAPAA